MARITRTDDDTSSGNSPSPTAIKRIRFSTYKPASPISPYVPDKESRRPRSAKSGSHRSGCICKDSVPVYIGRPPPHYRPRNRNPVASPQRYPPHDAAYGQYPGQMHMPYHTYIPQYPMYKMPQIFHRPHPLTPAQALHDFGYGPTPLFGWDSVVPLSHGYGQPRYVRHVKPDYRRFCFSVGKADVPFAALPGGPLYGFPTTMSPQLLNRF